jgi:hypothetical protein
MPGVQCTLGFVARDAVNKLGMFSNSHCSTQLFGVDLSAMYQPTSGGSNLIGYETQDPLPWDCDGGGPGTINCRYSDTAFWVKQSRVSASFARIARTLGWTGFCAGRANYNALGGDSGAPVFWWDYPTANVKLVGMHFASTSTYSVFSTMAGIREDFGNIDTY